MASSFGKSWCLIVTALVAAAAVLAVRFQWPILSQTALMLVFFTLLVSGLAIRYNPPRRREFAVGFCLFGSVYLGLCFNMLGLRIYESLVTTTILNRIHESVDPMVPANQQNWYIAQMSYNNAGHPVFTMLIGLLGGLLAEHWSSRAAESSRPDAEPHVTT
ncbi:MAG: hypothetical protein KGM43_07120 [Planctomycetota bacterium]|nr:hypothetical protein [Planctomycetota bacterium]